MIDATYRPGIDLLIAAFALHHGARSSDRLMVIRGVPQDVNRSLFTHTGVGIHTNVTHA